MKEKKILYYKDELNDEFSGIQRNTKEIGKGYKYFHGFLWNTAAFFVYRVFIYPFAVIYCKIKFHLKIENRKIFKSVKGGYFMFANHTQVPGDGFFSAFCAFPKKHAVLVNADNVSLKGTENLMLMLGALPIPNKINGIKDFFGALERLYDKGTPITVYPEAHIWPYYTKIRPFTSVSMHYPVKLGAPSFAYTVTYQKRKHSEKPNVVIYCDGPFYGEGETDKIKEEDLKNKLYISMVNRSENSDCEYIIYKKAEKND